jgi:predicted RND superfamily exporter protein
MDKVLRVLRPLLSLNYKYPVAVIAGAVMLATIASYFAVQLKIDTDLANLLPENNEHVLALEELQRTVGGESQMTVAIQSPSFADNKRFAEDLIDESLKLYDDRRDDYFFDRADFKKETDVLKDNALYFATAQELQNITEYLQDEIRGSKEDANPFLIDFGDDEEEVEETIIESTETNQEEIVEVREVVEAPVEEVIADVPFAVIENVPIYPGCESMKNNDQRKKCMSEKIDEFVRKKFNAD